MKLLINTWLSGERPGHFDEIHEQAVILRSDSVSGTTKPVPFSKCLIEERGYEVAIVAIDVWGIGDSRFDSSGAICSTIVDVVYAGVAQITLLTCKSSPLENLMVKGPEPEILVTSTPLLTAEFGKT